MARSFLKPLPLPVFRCLGHQTGILLSRKLKLSMSSLIGCFMEKLQLLLLKFQYQVLQKLKEKLYKMFETLYFTKIKTF